MDRKEIPYSECPPRPSAIFLVIVAPVLLVIINELLILRICLVVVYSNSYVLPPPLLPEQIKIKMQNTKRYGGIYQKKKRNEREYMPKKK